MSQKPLAMPADAGIPLEQYEEAASSLLRSWKPALPARFTLVIARLALAFAVLLLVAAAALFSVRTFYADKIYPSISVGGVNVGGMSHAEAATTLETQANAILNSRLTLSYGTQSWSPTFAELGVKVDLPAAIDEAFAVGREDEASDRVDSAYGLIKGNRTVSLHLTVNETQLEMWFDQVDADLGVPGQNASLVIDGGTVTLVPEIDGIQIDRDLARGLVVSSLQTLTPFTGALPTKAVIAEVHTADLLAAKTELDQALAAPIRLKYGNHDWTLNGADLGAFVDQNLQDQEGGAPLFSVSLDQKRLENYLTALIRDEVDRDSRNAVVGWDYDKAKLISIERSANGVELRPDALTAEVVASFWGTEKNIKVPVSVVKPEIDSKNLKALGITTKLGVGDSNFEGSDSGRATNVQVGSSLLNGTMIPPHGEFSFNHAIGEITAELGYVEAGVVAGERIGKDIGGGICQVSTTVFRAAFYAGLPITEWNPHMYRLGFYEQDGWAPGLDASILQPQDDPMNGGDFKFTNPSDSWMLVESFVDGARVYVVIFGPDLGYDVQIQGPIYPDAEYPPTDDLEIVDDALEEGTIQQSEYALSGMDVSWQRTVYDRDGNLLWDRTFGTHFYPRGNVYKVSPDMRGKSPAMQDGN